MCVYSHMHMRHVCTCTLTCTCQEGSQVIIWIPPMSPTLLRWVSHWSRVCLHLPSTRIQSTCHSALLRERGGREKEEELALEMEHMFSCLQRNPLRLRVTVSSVCNHEHTHYSATRLQVISTTSIDKGSKHQQMSCKGFLDLGESVLLRNKTAPQLPGNCSETEPVSQKE